jgi:hypothetical protein
MAEAAGALSDEDDADMVLELDPSDPHLGSDDNEEEDDDEDEPTADGNDDLDDDEALESHVTSEAIEEPTKIDDILFRQPHASLAPVVASAERIVTPAQLAPFQASNSSLNVTVPASTTSAKMATTSTQPVEHIKIVGKPKRF